MPMTVPNQKTIIVHKESAKGKIFAQIEMNALEKAAQDLDAGAFKLWVYFAKNQNDYKFALSRKAVEDSFGMKKAQYDNAVHELIDKGYLKCLRGNTYLFRDYPEEKEKAEAVVLKENHASASQKADVSKEHHTQNQKDTTRGAEKAPEIIQNRINIREDSFASQTNPQQIFPQLKEIPERLVKIYYAGMDYTIEDGILSFAEGEENHGIRFRVVPD